MNETRNGERRLPGEAKREIAAAARECFAQNGYHNTSTRMISERSGVVEALIFRHFGSKKKLFQETVVASFSQQVSEYMDTASEPWVTFDIGLLELLDRNRAEFVAIMTADAFEEGVVDMSRDASLTALVNRMEELVTQGIGDYGWKNVDPRVNSRIILATVFGLSVFGRMLFHEGSPRPDTESMTKAMLNLIVYGLGHLPPDDESVRPDGLTVPTNASARRSKKTPSPKKKTPPSKKS